MKKCFLHILPVLCALYFVSCSDDSGVTPSTIPVSKSTDTPLIPASNTLGTLIHDGGAFNGYTLFTIHKTTYLIDNCGQVIKQWVSAYERGGAFHLLEDGSLLRAGKIDNPEMSYGGIGGIIEKFNWDGDLTWSYRYSSATYSQHHGLVPMPNGNILFLSAHKKTKDETLIAGRKSENLSDTGLYDERIIEIKPSGTQGATIVWEWKVWDHLIQDHDPDKDNYGIITEHPGLLDINFLGSSTGDTDWLHFNAIDYNAALDQIMISSQKLGEIYVIDHSTTTEEAQTGLGGNSGLGGNIIYRWGNPSAYQHGEAGHQKLFGQHNAHWIPNNLPDGGKILIFNNGLGRNSDYSTIDIISTSNEGTYNYVYNQGQPFEPQEAEWTYIDPEDPTNFYSKILSSAQRLPNGNTLICEGTKGTFFEIDKDQNIVWKYVNPITNQGNRLKQGDAAISNVFQVLKYSHDYKGFTGKDLTPGIPLELDFDIGNCEP